MMKIQKYINWVYIILLIFPIFWLVLAPIWYYWTINTFGIIPHNDYLYTIENFTNIIGENIVGKLDAYMTLGTISLIGFVYSCLITFVISPIHLLISKVKIIKNLNYCWKKNGLIFIVILLIFILNFIPKINLFYDKFLNFLLD